MTSALGRGVRCEVCGAPDKACSHASTEGVTGLDPADATAVDRSPATRTYRVSRPEWGGVETRMRLNDGAVADLERLGATVTADPA